MNVRKPSQNSKLVDNLQQGISTGFQLFKNVESKIRQKSSKSGHNTPGNMTPSQVSPTHEPMTTDDVKSRGSHGTPTSPTKSMGSNKSSGNKLEESYRFRFKMNEFYFYKNYNHKCLFEEPFKSRTNSGYLQLCNVMLTQLDT